MRRISHAVRVSGFLLASAVCAGPASAAGDGKSSAWIRVQQLPLGGSMNQSAPAAGKEKWIEIQGWDWEIESEAAATFKGEVTGIEPVYKAGSTAADKSGRVKVKFAWDGCSRGARLPSLELKDARTLYLLEDVSVAACAADGATFRYARLRRSPVSSSPRSSR